MKMLIKIKGKSLEENFLKQISEQNFIKRFGTKLYKKM
jgi:hypothetical protein